MHEKLHFMQARLALLRVEFVGLLRVKLVNVGVTAVDVRASLTTNAASRVAALPKAPLAPRNMPLSYFLPA